MYQKPLCLAVLAGRAPYTMVRLPIEKDPSIEGSSIDPFSFKVRVHRSYANLLTRMPLCQVRQNIRQSRTIGNKANMTNCA
jgi:hypothetical protein